MPSTMKELKEEYPGFTEAQIKDIQIEEYAEFSDEEMRKYNAQGIVTDTVFDMIMKDRDEYTEEEDFTNQPVPRPDPQRTVDSLEVEDPMPEDYNKLVVETARLERKADSLDNVQGALPDLMERDVVDLLGENDILPSWFVDGYKSGLVSEEDIKAVNDSLSAYKRKLYPDGM